MKKKVLLVIPTLLKGGAERMVVNIATGLQKQGYKVKIILFYNEIEYPITNLDVEVIEIKIELSLIRKAQINVLNLQNTINQFNPNIVHSHLFESEIALAHIQFPNGIKRIVHFHDNMIQMKRFRIETLFSKQKLTNFYERKIVLKHLVENNTSIITISKHTNIFVNQELGDTIHIHTLLNAVDLDLFKPSIRNKVNEEFTTCMIGSFVNKKGQSLAIDTIFELKKRNLFVRLVLIGDGDNNQALKNQTKALQLEGQISFTGKIKNPESILQESHFYLHTAEYEPFGLVLIEAMGCGLPVICTDGGGNKELIVQGENGILIENRDPKLIADKIQLLLENENLRMNMAKKAQEFSQSFGMNQYTEKLTKLYEL